MATKPLKTEWTCSFCGQSGFKSRSSRKYHIDHACEKNPNSPAFKPENLPEKEPENPEEISTPQKTIAENRKAYEQETGTEIPDPDTESGDEVEVEDPPASEEMDIVSVLAVFFICIVILVVSGAIVFRERIVAFLQQRPKRPAPVVSYG